MRNFPSKGGGEPQLTLSGTLRAYLCHQGSGDGNDIEKMKKIRCYGYNVHFNGSIFLALESQERQGSLKDTGIAISAN